MSRKDVFVIAGLVSTHRRFQVSVSKSILVHEAEPLEHLIANLLCFVLRQRLGQILMKITVGQVLHGNEDVVIACVPAIRCYETLLVLHAVSSAGL